MSTSTTTHDAHRAPPADDHNARPDSDDRAATDRAATASDRLWAALRTRPGGTADELSGDAGIGRSTAAKILAQWVADGTATRVGGDGKRSAFRYTVPASVDTTPPGGKDDAATGPNGPSTGADRDRTGVRGATAQPDNATADAPAVVAPVGATTGPAPEALAGADEGAVAAAEVDSATATAAPADAAAARTADAAPSDDSTEGDGSDDAIPPAAAAVRGPRLAPGALHGMVEDYLRDHPEEQFGPTKIGRDLRRSTGAVGNALERLVSAGYAVRTNDRPKRYALAPAAAPADCADSNVTESSGA